MKIRCSIFLYIILCLIVILSSCTKHKRSASDYFHNELQVKLALAAERGDIDKIDKLLAKGAYINYKGKEKVTALMWAMYCFNKIGFKHLLEKGADPNIFMEHGCSVTELAASVPDIWYLKAVIKYGGNVNLVNPQSHDTILISSIHPGRLEQVKLLVESGANLNYQGDNGWTATMHAAILNQYDIVYYLIETGADPTINDKWGDTIMDMIKKSNMDRKSSGQQWMLKVIELLKTKGIEVNYKG